MSDTAKSSSSDDGFPSSIESETGSEKSSVQEYNSNNDKYSNNNKYGDNVAAPLGQAAVADAISPTSDNTSGRDSNITSGRDSTSYSTLMQSR